ncbi:MAG TPA: hypothetical protein EYQ18_21160 [Candidatus Handelsmanbacteria bacterium]|nr:hypothetical protein [Candidatus Handelsmanbacteria bacterium]
MPGPVAVAGVQDAFAEDGTCQDPALEKCLRGLATHLLDYFHENICPRVALEAMVREKAAG